MRPRKVSPRTVDRLRDEVYRQMLRLEAECPAARVLLGAALLTAWMTLDQQPPDCEPRQWLRKLSPVCLRMIRTSRRTRSGDCDPEDPGGTAEPIPESGNAHGAGTGTRLHDQGS